MSEPTRIDRIERRLTRTPKHYGARLVIAVALGAYAVFVLQMGTDLKLECADPAGGGLALQTSFTAAGAAAVTESCTAAQLSDHVSADFRFMVAYGLGLAAICFVFGPQGYRLGILRRASRLMAVLALLAAVFDAIETAIIGWKVEGGPVAAADLPSDVWFNVMTMAAWSKFILLAPVIAYAVVAVCGFVSRPAWIDFDDPYPLDPDEPPVVNGTQRSTAIALSGGGVRSAVFSFGGLQALDEHPLTEDEKQRGYDAAALGYDAAGRVVSVSGGGYMAGGWALGRLANPDNAQQADERSTTWRDPGDDARRRGEVSEEELHLADNLRYLMEARRGRPGAIVTVLSGVAVNIAVFLLVLFVVSRPFGWVVASDAIAPGLRADYGSDDRMFDPSARHWGPPLLAGATSAISLVVWVLASRVFRFEMMSSITDFFHERLRPLVLATAVLAVSLTLLLLVLPWAMIEVPKALNVGDGSSSDRGLIASVTAAVGAAGSIAGTLKSAFGPWLKRLGGFLLLAGAVLLGGQWASNAAINGPNDDVGLWLALAIAVAVGYFLANPEWWSLAPFYRGRLRLAYAYSRRKKGAYHGGDEPLLADIQPGDGPTPTFCAAVHVQGPQGAGVEGTDHHDTNPAFSLTMAPDQIAIHRPVVNERRWVSETCRPEKVEHLMWKGENPRLNVMFAAAVSGAAVAPALGRMSFGSTDMLLAFANVRLGVWIPNPRHAMGVPSSALGTTGAKNEYRLPRVRIGYLLKELFGVHDPDDLYVYATDGGHWENTAIVEALRGSEVTEITAFDGSGVTADTTTPLAEAVNLAALELGDEIDIDIDRVRAQADDTRGGRFAQRNVAVGVIRRRDGGLAVLWYARPTLTKYSSTGLKAYAERDPDFPSHSTLDQFFDREQFENYRLLGFEAGETIVRARQKVQEVLKGSTDVAGFKRRAKLSSGAGTWAVRELSFRVHEQAEFEQLRELFEPAVGWDRFEPAEEPAPPGD